MYCVYQRLTKSLESHVFKWTFVEGIVAQLA